MRAWSFGRSSGAVLGLLCLLASPAAFAQMLDLDGLLVEASAVPTQGTVRISGSGGGQTAAGDSEAVANVAGSVMWVPFRNFGGDVGAYYQGGRSGPSARLRYQLLSQETGPFNLALGARYKSEGFSGPGSGEVEALLALGRSWGRLDVALNFVWGWEINDPGMDAELKVLVAWRFSDNLRLGVEARAQSEIHDEDGWKGPQMLMTDIRGGPTLVWRIAKPVSVQLLVGVAKPVEVTSAGFLALGALAIDL